MVVVLEYNLISRTTVHCYHWSTASISTAHRTRVIILYALYHAYSVLYSMHKSCMQYITPYALVNTSVKCTIHYIPPTSHAYNTLYSIHQSCIHLIKLRSPVMHNIHYNQFTSHAYISLNSAHRSCIQ